MSELQKALIQGMEPAEKIDILIGLTDISSEDNIVALHRYYVNGWPITTAAESRSLDEANFRKTVKSLEAVAVKLERYKEIEWSLTAILLSAILILGYCGLVAVGVDFSTLLRSIHENF